MSKKSPLKVCSSLTEAIEFTVKNPSTQKSVEQIADDCDVCPSMVYRWYKDPESSSYAKLTVDNLKRLLESTKNFSILDYLERRTGRIAIPIPKGMMTKTDEGEMVDGYRELSANVIKLLIDFFKKPDTQNKQTLDAALEEVMRSTASIKKYCDKKSAGQYEIDLQ